MADWARELPLCGPHGEFDELSQTPLGEGGQALVFTGLQRGAERRVAVKRSRDGLRHERLFDELIRNEAESLAALDHPDIVTLHAVTRTPAGRPALVMEQVEGVTWEELFDAPYHPMWEDFGATEDPHPLLPRLRTHLQILQRVAAALHHVHEAGLLHADIKPSNVIVGALGRVTLLDFGVARRLARDTPLDEIAPQTGTAAYMAPEMVYEKPLRTPATDVFQLGAVLHRLLTGYGPYEREAHLPTLVAAAQNQRKHPYPKQIPEELVALCEKATAHEPADRFPTPLDFRAALEHFVRRWEARELLKDAADEAERLIEGPTDDFQACMERFQGVKFRLEVVATRFDKTADVRSVSERCEAFLARVALENGELEWADQLIAAAGEPPALRQRWHELEKTRRQGEQKLERLDALVQDADTNVGWQTRRSLMIGLAYGSALALLALGEYRRLVDAAMGVEVLTWVASGLALVCAGAAAWFWSSMSANAAGRKLVVLVLLLVVMLGLHFVLAHLVGMTFRQAIILMMLICTLCSSLIAELVERRLRAAWLALLASVPLATAMPGWELHVMAVATLVAGLSLIPALAELLPGAPKAALPRAAQEPPPPQ